jgi:hypothetical protein
MDAHASDAHGHEAQGHDAHGHGAQGHDAHGAGAPADAHAGPAEIPPVPALRSITPAAADYALPHPGAGLLWPVLWLAVAALLYAAAGRTARPIEAHGGDGPGSHEAPAH